MPLLPDHAPEAVQEVALAEDHDNVAALPLATLLGDAFNWIVGAVALTETVADCWALPPGPVQVKV
jgi:predicted MFS family arabinose efflux permease